MFLLITCMATGILVGILGKKRIHEKTLGKLLSFCIFLLLFLIGVGVGKDQELLIRLPLFGLDALIITVFGIIGSVIIAKFIYIKGRKHEK